MFSFSIIAIFVLGLVVGSFLNVVILRYNTGRTIQGRSSCSSCGRILSWYELIPVASFFMQFGRCRSCRSAISFQYPLVELSTGVLFSLAFITYSQHSDPFVNMLESIIFILILAVLSFLVVITIYDLKHKIIPDPFVYAFSLVSLILLLLGPEEMRTTLNFLAGPILASPFALLWFVSKGRWMGFGDAKLALGMGWFLGLFESAIAFVIAFWVGALYGVIVLLLRSIGGGGRLPKLAPALTMKSEIPLAPFLVLGTLIVFFLRGSNVLAGILSTLGL